MEKKVHEAQQLVCTSYKSHADTYVSVSSFVCYSFMSLVVCIQVHAHLSACVSSPQIDDIQREARSSPAPFHQEISRRVVQYRAHLASMKRQLVRHGVMLSLKDSDAVALSAGHFSVVLAVSR